MTRLTRILALTACIALTGPAFAQNQEVVKATYGAWTIRCTEAQSVCVMHQIAKGPEGNDLLEVRIRKLEGVKADNGQTVPAAIQIASPLGVLLRAGVRVQIDSGQTRTGAFEICVPGTCLVRDLVPEAFLDEMKRGSTARMTIASPQQGEVVATISLNGFTRSFGELQP